MSHPGSDRTVLITGGGRGIGFELAKLCTADGATIVLVDVSEATLNGAVEELRKLGARAEGFVHDVTDRDGCYALRRRIEDAVGHVDVLVNNAGIVHKGDFLAGEDSAWAHTVDVNLNGVMWMMHAFMPSMVKRGRGHVVNVASILGLAPAGGAAVYCATKHAVIALTEAVRFELLERGYPGVHLTAACPGFTDTGMFRGVRTPPMFRAVAPRDTAKAIYRGMRRRSRVIRYPYRFYFLPQFYALCPHPLWRAATRLLGVHRAMDSHTANRLTASDE